MTCPHILGNTRYPHIQLLPLCRSCTGRRGRLVPRGLVRKGRDQTEMDYTLRFRLLRWSLWVLRAGLPRMQRRIQEAVGKPLIVKPRMVSEDYLNLVTVSEITKISSSAPRFSANGNPSHGTK